jgi:hypothetical protein
MVKEYADRAMDQLRKLLILPRGGSANNSLSFVGCHFHQKCLFRITSLNPPFAFFLAYFPYFEIIY